MGDALLSGAAPARLARVSAALLAAVWVCELVQIVVPVPALAHAGMGALAAFLLLACTRASGHVRVLFLVLASVSGAIAWHAGAPGTLLHGVERAQIFGGFIPSVLLLRATVEASPRLARMREGMDGLGCAASQNWTLYGSHALGAVLNVGAMSILAPVVARGADAARRAGLAGSSARGVGTAVMWSPFFVALAFTSQLVPQAVPWQAMALGMLLAALGLGLSTLFYTPGVDRATLRASVARLGPLIGPMGTVIAGVVLASELLHLGGLQAVALVVPIFCLGYLAAAGRGVARQTASRTAASFGRLADEMLIVVGATVLATSVSALPLVQALAGTVVPGAVSGAGLIAALVFALLALGLAGLHPMIGVGIVMPVLAAAPFGVRSPVLVASAVFGWGLSAALSVWSLPVVAASLQFSVPVRALVTGRNLLFGVLYAASGVAVLAAANAAWPTP